MSIVWGLIGNYLVEILLGLAVAFGLWQRNGKKEAQSVNKVLVESVEREKNHVATLEKVAITVSESQERIEGKVDEAIEKAKSDRTDFFN